MPEPEPNPLVSDAFDALLAAALRFAEDMRAWRESHFTAAIRELPAGRKVLTGAEVERIEQQVGEWFMGDLLKYTRLSVETLFGDRETVSPDDARDMAIDL